MSAIFRAISAYTIFGLVSCSFSAHASPTMVFDRAGNLFFADSSNNAILKFAPGGTKTTFADRVGTGSLAIDANDNS